MNRKGFTLVEVIVVLVVLSILVAIAVPLALKIFERTAEDSTREEMDNIKIAIIGDARKLQSSFRSNFGFLGDIGCLPTPSVGGLDRLLTNGTLPIPFTFDSTKQTGAGWNGPYITGTPGEEFKTDQWGIDYTYTVSGACPLTATLTSSGASTSLTSDDITVTIALNETTATVRGTVKDTGGNLLEAVPVEFYSAVSGALSTAGPVDTDANGNYSFSSVPFGPRAVRAKPRFVYSPGSVTTGGGGQNVIFTIVNYSEVAETIDRMKADYTGGATYNSILINGTPVDPPGAFSSGTDVPVFNTVIPASSAVRPSMRVVVDSPDVQLPDIAISGQGTIATVELRFNQKMIGVPITVTFNPTGGLPISIVKFTP